MYDIIKYEQEVHLEGRVIKDIVAIGMGYGWTGDHICDMVWGEVVTIPITQAPQIAEGYPAAELFQNISKAKTKFLKKASKWLKKFS